jgi:NitT/TauT family transport system substrate-binding protein
VTGLAVACGGEEAAPVAVDDPATAGAQPQAGQTGDVAEEEPGELTPVMFRFHFVPSGSQGPLWLAKERGYYEEEGIDIQLEVGQGSQFAVTEVATGNADFSSAGGANIMIGIGQGQEVVSVASWVGQGSFGFFVPEDSDIESIADMDGARLVTAPGTPQAILTPAALEANGVDPSTLEYINVDAAALLQTYASGEGDALVTSIPFGAPLVQAQRPSTELLWSQSGLSVPDYGFVAHRDTVAERPEIVRSFLRATLKGIEDAMEDPDAAIDALVANHPEVNADDARTQMTNFFEFYCPLDFEGQPYGMHKPEDWEEGVEALREYTDVSDDIPASEFYTNEFFEGSDSVAVSTC